MLGQKDEEKEPFHFYITSLVTSSRWFRIPDAASFLTWYYPSLFFFLNWRLPCQGFSICDYQPCERANLSLSLILICSWLNLKPHNGNEGSHTGEDWDMNNPRYYVINLCNCSEWNYFSFFFLKGKGTLVGPRLVGICGSQERVQHSVHGKCIWLNRVTMVKINILLQWDIDPCMLSPHLN